MNSSVNFKNPKEVELTGSREKESFCSKLMREQLNNVHLKSRNLVHSLISGNPFEDLF